MNIEYNAVIEILKKFLDNEKIEILGISVGEERQVRDAIKNLLTAYEKEKEANRKLDKEAQGYLEELAGDDSMNIRRIQELEAELEKEKEKNKEYENMIINHKKQLKQSGIYGYDYDLKILKEE